MADEIVIALAGNPNSGKTTLFNELTGSHQHVGNYPGVTVEKKEGVCRHGGRLIRVVDLPGTYSLTAYSVEERVAREFMVHEHPDVIVDVVDATNLERNLYLTTQLIELNQPLVVALNMMDVAEHSGRSINHLLLGQLLGTPLVPISAARRHGLDELLDVIVRVADEKTRPSVRIRYGEELEQHVDQVERLLDPAAVAPWPVRWVAVKLLEGDVQARQQVAATPAGAATLEQVDRIRHHLEQIVGDDPEVAITDRRYGFVAGAVREALCAGQQCRIDWSEAADRIIVNRVLGLPIFLMLVALMFEAVFRLGAWPMQKIEWLFATLGEWVRAILPPGDIQSLVVDGVIHGVGSVLVFVPNIMLLFLAIAILEDTGYMARAAFVMDRLMHRVGLHGKSCIPLLIGFGCTVPAILATRTLDQRRDRIVTMLVATFMSCGARLPVYVLLAGAFFPPDVAGQVILSIYVLGVIVAGAVSAILRGLVLRGPTTPFVMELPPYRMPTGRGLAIHVWERTWQYIKKAGTIILVFAVSMWGVLTYPRPPQERLAGLTASQQAAVCLEYSLAGRVGKALEPLVRPLGCDWKVAVALLAGIGAKEVIVSTLGTAYSLAEGDEHLSESLRRDAHLTPLDAYALMVFILLYVPCLSTLTVMGRELQSIKWPLFAAAYTLVVAWVLAFAVHEFGTLLGLGQGH